MASFLKCVNCFHGSKIQCMPFCLIEQSRNPFSFSSWQKNHYFHRYIDLLQMITLFANCTPTLNGVPIDMLFAYSFICFLYTLYAFYKFTPSFLMLIFILIVNNYSLSESNSKIKFVHFILH